jgi:hypothetical protein
MPVRSTGKPSIGRYALLAALLAATTAYNLRTIDFRFPEWLGRETVGRPFFIPEVEIASSGEGRNLISFVRPEARDAGVRDGDKLLAVNGMPVTGMAVYGEAVRKAHPGDKIVVTVASREPDGTTSEKNLAIPFVPTSYSLCFLFVVLLFRIFSYLLGLWVVFFVRSYGRSWLFLALMLGFVFFFVVCVVSW